MKSKTEPKHVVQVMKGLALAKVLDAEKERRKVQGKNPASMTMQDGAAAALTLGEAVGLLAAVAVIDRLITGAGVGEWAGKVAEDFGMKDAFLGNLDEAHKLLDHAEQSEAGRKVFNHYGVHFSSQEGGR